MATLTKAQKGVIYAELLALEKAETKVIKDHRREIVKLDRQVDRENRARLQVERLRQSFLTRSDRRVKQIHNLIGTLHRRNEKQLDRIERRRLILQGRLS